MLRSGVDCRRPVAGLLAGVVEGMRIVRQIRPLQGKPLWDAREIVAPVGAAEDNDVVGRKLPNPGDQGAHADCLIGAGLLLQRGAPDDVTAGGDGAPVQPGGPGSAERLAKEVEEHARVVVVERCEVLPEGDVFTGIRQRALHAAARAVGLAIERRAPLQIQDDEEVRRARVGDRLNDGRAVAGAVGAGVGPVLRREREAHDVHAPAAHRLEVGGSEVPISRTVVFERRVVHAHERDDAALAREARALHRNPDRRRWRGRRHAQGRRRLGGRVKARAGSASAGMASEGRWRLVYRTPLGPQG